MKKSNFDKLLTQYLNGTLPEPDRKKLEAWLEVMKTENTTNLELSEEDEERLFKTITSRQQDVKNVKLHPTTGSATSPNRWYLAVAASLLMLIAVTAVLWHRIDNSILNQTLTQREKVILNDGSLVWLQPGSEISYTENPSTGVRLARLKGSALFEVAKDPSRPFIIRRDQVEVEVLGTSFSLSGSTDSVVVNVLTGKVHVRSNVDTLGLTLVANEKVTYTHGAFEKHQLHPEEKMAAIADTHYDMKFENAKLKEIVSRLAEKFEVEIIIDNPEIGSCRLTADFTDTSLLRTLDMITEVLSVSYRNENNTIFLSGKGCQ